MDGSFSQHDYWAGIDISSEKFDVAIAQVPPDLKTWSRLRARTFPATPQGICDFASWLREQPATCTGLCAEATGIYTDKVAQLLRKHAPELPPLSVVNPLHIKGAARMLNAVGKTDTIDARVIAIYAATAHPQPQQPISESLAHLRETMKVAHMFRKHEVARRNSLASIKDEGNRAVIKGFIADCVARREETEERIAAIIAGDPQLSADSKLLQTIPCIGPKVAAEILAFYGDLRRWNRREIIAAAGLAPMPRQSGKCLNAKPTISKRGGARLRARAYLGCLRLLRKDHGFNRQIVERFAAGEPGKRLMINAIAKLLVVARAVIISGKPFDEEYHKED